MASRNDCTPKARMLVISQRCATMRICSTSTAADISVIMRLPNCGSSQKWIMVVSEQKRGHQRQRRQNEGDGQQLGNTEQAELGIGGFHQHDGGGQQQELGGE